MAKAKKIQKVYIIRYLLGEEWITSHVIFDNKEAAEEWGKDCEVYYIEEVGIYKSVDQYLNGEY